MAFDASQYRDLFREEAAGNLQQLGEGLLALEAPGASAQEHTETINALFRAAHSLKGSARMLELGDIAEVAHHIEDLLDGLRGGTLGVSAELVDALLAGLDALQALISDQGSGGAAERQALVQRAVQDLAVARDRAESSAAAVPPDAVEEISPPTSRVEPTASRPAPSSGPRVSVPVERLDRVLRLAAQLISRAEAERARGDLPRELLQSISRAQAALASPAGPQLAEATRELLEARLAAERLARSYAAAEGHEDDFALAEELYHEASRTRMVPVEGLFKSFHRAVRDAERSLGKQIELVVEGTDTELDKRLLDALQDPLLHLVRNAMDHGIELPEVRQAAGKPARGTVRLSARPRGERVLVEVGDDGHGLDPEEFRKVAVKKGLLSERAAATLSDDDAVALMFRPGFSTREGVSEVSGRGVGMDVVKTMVDELEGQIAVSSRIGGGTTFTLSLPLSVAAMRVLLLRVDAGFGEASFLYGLPASAVERVEWLDAGTVEVDEEGRRWAQVDERPVMVHSLPAWLGATPRWSGPATLLRDGGGLALVLADALVGQTVLVVEPPSPLVRTVRSLAGSALLPDGTVVPVLQPGFFLSGEKLPHSAPTSVHSAPAPRVLLVDDLLLTRELERSVLVGAGYDVEVAADGAQALERLRDTERPLVDALVTDVELPRLTGLELTRAIREGHAGAANTLLPIVVVGGQTSIVDREEVLAAGAHAYLAKSDFDETTLTEALALALEAGAASARAR